MFDSILIPPKVSEEVGVFFSWLEIKNSSAQGLILALKLLVDHGDAEALALGYELNVKVILDEQKVRQVARKMKVSFSETIAILS